MQPNHTVTLTTRQKEIVKLRTLGESFQGIALIIGLSPKTAEYHWAKACRKIGLNDPVAIVHYALRTGLIKNLFSNQPLRLRVSGQVPLELEEYAEPDLVITRKRPALPELVIRHKIPVVRNPNGTTNAKHPHR